MKIQISRREQRKFDIKTISVEKRKIEITYEGENAFLTFPFSSEFPVERWGYVEVLSHDTGAMQTDRLDNHAPLLFNHDPDLQMGKVVKAWVENKIAWVTVKMARDSFTLEKLKNIEDEILVNVSFGYEIIDIGLTSDEKGKLPVYTSTRWMPYEVSFVTIPADYTVGLLRVLGQNKEFIEIERNVSPATPQLPEQNNKNKTGNNPDQIENQDIKVSEQKHITERTALMNATAEDIQKTKVDERKRFSEITVLAKKHKITDEEFVRGLIDSDKDLDQIKVAIFEKAYTVDNPPNPKIGMSEEDTQRYSIVKLIRHLAAPDSQRLQKEASFELSMSAAASKLVERELRGKVIPFDVLMRSRSKMRALSVSGGGAAGGYLVATEHKADNFIDLLRNKLILAAAGARVIDGLVGNIAIPRKSGSSQAYWLNEGSDITAESALSLGQILMSPKTLGAYTDLTRTLLMQSSPSAEMLVEDDLMDTLKLEIDRVGAYGPGVEGMPLGVKNIDGINTQDFVGAEPTFAELVGMETKTAQANADVAGMAYLINPATRGHAKTTPKFTNGEIPIWEPGNALNSYRAEVSNQIAVGDVFFGNWSDLIIGLWGGLELVASKEAKLLSGGLRLVSIQSIDYALRNSGSITYGNAGLA